MPVEISTRRGSSSLISIVAPTTPQSGLQIVFLVRAAANVEWGASQVVEGHGTYVTHQKIARKLAKIARENSQKSLGKLVKNRTRKLLRNSQKSLKKSHRKVAKMCKDIVLSSHKWLNFNAKMNENCQRTTRWKLCTRVSPMPSSGVEGHGTYVTHQKIP